MASQSTAEAVLMFRAKDEASKEIERLHKQIELFQARANNPEIKELNGQLERMKTEAGGAGNNMLSLTRNAVGAGLAMFGLSVSLRELVSTTQRLTDIESRLDATLTILAPRMREAFENVDVGALAREFATTESEIEGIIATIINNAGDVELSAEELAEAVRQAFGVMVLSGADASQAAAAVGQALQGNEEPLNRLVDASGRYRVNLEDASKAAEIHKDNITPIQHIWAAAQRQFENFVEALGRLSTGENPFDVIRDWWDGFWPDFSGVFADAWLKAARLAAMWFGPGVFGLYVEDAIKWMKEPDNWVELGQNIGEFIVDGVFEPIKEFFTETLPEWFKSVVPDAFGGLGDIFGSIGDAFGIGGDSAPDGNQSVAFTPGATGASSAGVTVIFQNPVIDTPERQAQITREVRRALSTEVRRGVAI